MPLGFRVEGLGFGVLGFSKMKLHPKSAPNILELHGPGSLVVPFFRGYGAWGP